MIGPFPKTYGQPIIDNKCVSAFGNRFQAFNDISRIGGRKKFDKNDRNQFGAKDSTNFDRTQMHQDRSQRFQSSQQRLSPCCQGQYCQYYQIKIFKLLRIEQIFLVDPWHFD